MYRHKGLKRLEGQKRLAVSSVHIGWQLLFYGVPLGMLLAVSFWIIESYQLVPALTTDNYETLISRPQYYEAVLNSLRLAILASCLSVLLALPTAYALVFYVSPRVQNFLILMLLVPFFSSYVMRMFSWQIWLSNQGIIAHFLELAFGYSGTLDILFTEMSILIGLLSVFVPISSILIYLSLSRLDRTLIAAARNLGAGPVQVFLRVELPFALPGVLISMAFCFLIAFGDFVCSSILGGNNVYYLSVAIQDRLKINQWPMASALGAIMLTLAILVLMMLFSLFGKLPTMAKPKPEGVR